MKIYPKFWLVIGVALAVLVYWMATTQPEFIKEGGESILVKDRPDWIIRSIQNHVAKEDAKTFSGFGSAGQASNRSPYNNQNRQGLTADGDASFSQQYYGVIQAPKVQPNVTQGNGYYPPPPIDKTIEANRNVSPSNVTSDGRQIAFAGAKVYFIDENGSRKRMPDGNYKLKNGNDLLVRGGRKMVVDN